MLFTEVLGLNHALGEHRRNRQSETPTSLLRSIKLWYIFTALLHSQDDRVKRHERSASAERGDLTLLPPVVNGACPSNIDKGEWPSPRSDGRWYVKEGVISMPSRGGERGSAQPPRGTARGRGATKRRSECKQSSRRRVRPPSLKQQRQRCQQVPSTQQKGVVPGGARGKLSTPR